MRTTVTIDDALYEEALRLADPQMDKADLFREAVKAFIQRQAARRMMDLGGMIPQAQDVPRRRDEPAASPGAA